MAKKKEMQRKYKEELDKHLQTRENQRVKGKMTGVEKQLNKDDLLAYKHYDGTQYAIVPGVTSNAKVLDRTKFNLPNALPPGELLLS